MENLNIADIRRNYTKEGLVDNKLPENPIELFTQWVEEAINSKALEPNAMALATVSPAGLPNVRMVLLKGIEDGSIRFYTNYNSRKGDDLTSKPVASCTFWWAELERQVRLSGPVERIMDAESESYFQSRPKEHQIGAWVSNQSSPVESREVLEEKFAEAKNRFKGRDIPKPEDWGGYDIHIQEIEFWQGRPGRLHDRIAYKKVNGAWQYQRLQP